MTERLIPITGPKYERRFSTREIVMFVQLLITIAALVWGAARISFSVDTLATSVAELKVQVKNLQDGTSNNGVMEYRLRQLEVQQDRIISAMAQARIKLNP